MAQAVRWLAALPPMREEEEHSEHGMEADPAEQALAAFQPEPEAAAPASGFVPIAGNSPYHSPPPQVISVTESPPRPDTPDGSGSISEDTDLESDVEMTIAEVAEIQQAMNVQLGLHSPVHQDDEDDEAEVIAQARANPQMQDLMEQLMLAEFTEYQAAQQVLIAADDNVEPAPLVPRDANLAKELFERADSPVRGGECVLCLHHGAVIAAVHDDGVCLCLCARCFEDHIKGRPDKKDCVLCGRPLNAWLPVRST